MPTGSWFVRLLWKTGNDRGTFKVTRVTRSDALGPSEKVWPPPSATQLLSRLEFGPTARSFLLGLGNASFEGGARANYPLPCIRNFGHCRHPRRYFARRCCARLTDQARQISRDLGWLQRLPHAGVFLRQTRPGAFPR